MLNENRYPTLCLCWGGEVGEKQMKELDKIPGTVQELPMLCMCLSNIKLSSSECNGFLWGHFCVHTARFPIWSIPGGGWLPLPLAVCVLAVLGECKIFKNIGQWHLSLSQLMFPYVSRQGQRCIFKIIVRQKWNTSKFFLKQVFVILKMTTLL